VNPRHNTPISFLLLMVYFLGIFSFDSVRPFGMRRGDFILFRDTGMVEYLVIDMKIDIVQRGLIIDGFLRCRGLVMIARRLIDRLRHNQTATWVEKAVFSNSNVEYCSSALGRIRLQYSVQRRQMSLADFGWVSCSIAHHGLI
jgi:hypothetical protein